MKQIPPHVSVLDSLLIFLFINTRFVNSSKDDRQTKIVRSKICSIDLYLKNFNLIQPLTI